MVYSNEDLTRELRDILKNRVLLNILEERKKSAQEEVNKFVNAQNLIEAFGALKRMEDNDKLLRIIENKIAQIEGEVYGKRN